MTRRTKKISFPNGRGQMLSGLVDFSETEPLYTGIFSPCFTCQKESHAAAKICRALAAHGVTMLRFDTTGVGESEGDYREENFTGRIQDIAAAGRALEDIVASPKLLIGHSLSGPAVISAAHQIGSVQAIATVNAPCDPERVVQNFRRHNLLIEKDDQIIINVLGHHVPFAKGFVEDMLSQTVAQDTETLDCKLFVFHAPQDQIVIYENAEIIHDRARKNAAENDVELVRLDEDATHLFENRDDDAVLIAETIQDWFRVHLA